MTNLEQMVNIFALSSLKIFVPAVPTHPDSFQTSCGLLSDVAFLRERAICGLFELDPLKYGFDGVCPHLLKSCAGKPYLSLHQIYEKSRQSSTVPMLCNGS